MPAFSRYSACSGSQCNSVMLCPALTSMGPSLEPTSPVAPKMKMLLINFESGVLSVIVEKIGTAYGDAPQKHLVQRKHEQD